MYDLRVKGDDESILKSILIIFWEIPIIIIIIRTKEIIWKLSSPETRLNENIFSRRPIRFKKMKIAYFQKSGFFYIS